MRVAELKNQKALHHSYVVSGSESEGVKEVLVLLESRGVKTRGNPDVMIFPYGELLVDDVRERILPYASLKAVTDKKYLIISFTRANEAAQNALLKAVEEPQGSSIFFFSVDRAGYLLPTLLSRSITLEAKECERDPEKKKEAGEFLSEGYALRLTRVEKMSAYASKNQDRSIVRALVNELLLLGRERGFTPETMRDLLDAAKYLRLQGVSVKSILGHLAVSLPRG